MAAPIQWLLSAVLCYYFINFSSPKLNTEESPNLKQLTPSTTGHPEATQELDPALGLDVIPISTQAMRLRNLTTAPPLSVFLVALIQGLLIRLICLAVQSRISMEVRHLLPTPLPPQSRWVNSVGLCGSCLKRNILHQGSGGADSVLCSFASDYSA